MPFYLRKLFGDSSNHSSRSNPSKSDKQPHVHAHFVEVNPRVTANPRVDARRGHTPRSGAPSPLGPPTPLRPSVPVDTRTQYGYGKAYGTNSTSSSDLRPQVLRRASYNKTPAAPHSAMHAHSAGVSTPASSRSNSSTSIFATMNSVPYHDSHRHASHVRPPLPTTNSWQSSSSIGSSHYQPQPVAYVQPRPSTLHMHPLLAYTRLHHAPISYDVTFTPSNRTVLDRTTQSAIPSHTLAEPATDPPTPSTARLILRSHKFPWTIVVTGSGPRFTVGPPKQRRVPAISNLDLLYAVHTTLMTPVTPEEWESLGHGSRAQQKVTKAYERRCTRMGGGWEGGVRRVDWLGEKTRLVGIEVDKSVSVGKLVFAKA